MHPENIARICHEANRLYQIVNDEKSISPEWFSAEPWMRDSTMEGVSLALEGASAEDLHDSWMEFMVEKGWKYGVERDPDLKTHPNLVPYADLPEDQKKKDALFHAIAHALGD